MKMAINRGYGPSTPERHTGINGARTERAFSFSPLHLLLMLCLQGGYAAEVWADDYFDPAFLSDMGGAAVDLAAFSKPGGVSEGTYLVDIVINQKPVTTRQVRFSRNKKGDIVPELTPAALRDMGVATGRIDTFKGLPDDKPVEDLRTLIPSSSVDFSMSTLTLTLSIPQVNMDEEVAGRTDPRLWNEGVPAMMFNYNLNGSDSRTDGTYGSSGNTNRSLYAGLNGGVNLGPWRLRSTLNYSSYETSSGNYHSKDTDTEFSNVYLQRDVQRLNSYLTMGEYSTGGDVFDSIPFRGAMLTSTEDMLPTGQRGFSPVLTGIANSNAQVTVTQNGHVIYQTSVPPGPFRLTDVYQAGGGGDLMVTVTEADGTKHTSNQSFSTLPVMKRQGSVSWEVTTARYKNGGYTTGSEDPVFAMATAMVGLPHYVTLYGGLLGAKNYLSVALGTGLSLGIAGALSVDMTLAQAKLEGIKGDQNGAAFRARYSKSMMSTGTTVDVTAYRYATHNFYTFQDAMSSGYELEDGWAPWMGERRRSSWQTALSQNLSTLGSLSLHATRDDYWGSNRVVNTVGAGFSSSIKGVSWSVNYNIDHTQGSDDEWPTNRQVSLNVSVPFSLFNPRWDAVRNIQSNYSVSHDSQGRTQQQEGLSGSLMDGKVGWSVSQNQSNQGGGNSGNVGLSYSGDEGSVSTGYGYGSGTRTTYANGSGGVIIHPHGVSFSNYIGDSMALVEAPGAGDVAVLNGGTETDSRGYAVVPFLQNYQGNTISLDPATLPDGVDVKNNSVVVYPTKGAVVEAKFRTRVGRQAMLTLTYLGKPVPFGAVVSMGGDDLDNTAIVGDDGLVYVTGAPQTGILSVQWGRETDQQCSVSYDLGVLPERNEKHAAINVAQQTLSCQPLTDTIARAQKSSPAPVAKVDESTLIQDKAAQAMVLPAGNKQQ